MPRSTRHRLTSLALLASSTLWLSTCAMNLRDAVIGGAMDFVAGSTTALIDAWLPIVPAA